MENSKGQTIFLSVVGVATLLVAIVGATFAFFSITVEGNEEASSIIVRTALLTNIVFEDGDEVSVLDAYPGAYVDKKFTITAPLSEGQALTADALPTDYQIRLSLIDKDLLTALETAGKLTEMHHSLSLAPVAEGETDTNVNALTVGTTTLTGTQPVFEDTAMTLNQTTVAASTEALVGTAARIYPTMVHNYVYRVHFIESNGEQNYAQGRRFVAKLQVTASSEGHYTTGAGGSGSSEKQP